MKAFYFSEADKKLGHDDGRTHKVKGKPVLHASERLLDALYNADGPYLWLVNLGGEIEIGDDQAAATERTYLGGFDASELLFKFARKQALINIDKIRPYCPELDFELIVTYLNTGKGRPAAESVARSAARFAAMLATESAANDMLTEMVKEKTGWSI